jgi:DMSO/TMAO reductase YedYZ molybdopterin-dependent catalytic subunit
VAGLLAAGGALLVLVLGRAITDRPGLVETISDGFSRYLPLSVFEFGVSNLGPLAKGLLTLGIAAGILLAGALVGAIALRRLAQRGSAWAFGAVVVSALVAVELVVLPVFGAGFLGLDLASDKLAVQLPLVIAALTYAGLLIGLRETWLEIGPEPGSAVEPAPELPFATPTPAVGELSRRRFMGTSLALAGALAAAGSIAALFSQVLAAVGRGGPAQVPDTDPTGFGPTPAQTPVDDFYTVHKNLGPTVVDGASWALVIDGLVERPENLSLEQLRALPYQEAYRTLECISTEIIRGDHLIGNQHWRGTRVADLLDRVGVKPEARWVLWEADDGFTESIPVEVARHPDTWITYQMADAPLTVDHGFPARVLIPGRFGMKQPKWLRRMRLADHDESGYWVQRGWDKDAFQRTMSRVDWPRHRSKVTADESFMAFGVAFAGDRGIKSVEVSTDNGVTWLPAELEDATMAPLGELSWVRWRVALTLAAAGSVRLAVRATDGDGATQSGEVTSSLPSGSTGWHRIDVEAVAAAT